LINKLLIAFLIVSVFLGGIIISKNEIIFTKTNIVNKNVDKLLIDVSNNKEKLIKLENKVSKKDNNNIVNIEKDTISISNKKSINNKLEVKNSTSSVLNTKLNMIKKTNINTMIESKDEISLVNDDEEFKGLEDVPLLPFDIVYNSSEDTESVLEDNEVTIDNSKKENHNLPPMPPSHLMKQY